MNENRTFAIKYACGLICADADSLANAALTDNLSDSAIDRAELLLASKAIVGHIERLLELLK